MPFRNGRYYNPYDVNNYFVAPGQSQGVFDPTGSARQQYGRQQYGQQQGQFGGYGQQNYAQQPYGPQQFNQQQGGYNSFLPQYGGYFNQPSPQPMQGQSMDQGQSFSQQPRPINVQYYGRQNPNQNTGGRSIAGGGYGNDYLSPEETAALPSRFGDPQTVNPSQAAQGQNYGSYGGFTGLGQPRPYSPLSGYSMLGRGRNPYLY